VLVCATDRCGQDRRSANSPVHLALGCGSKSASTPRPIKALSNQEAQTILVARYGPETPSGPAHRRPSRSTATADIVVMTTGKCFATMLLLCEPQPALYGLFARPSWTRCTFWPTACAERCGEEVILHLPDEVRLVSLSATVSNAEEFGGWIQTVAPATPPSSSTNNRPVPLWQHVIVGKRLLRPVSTTAPRERRSPAVSFSGRPRSAAPHRKPTRGADRLADWPAARPGAVGRPEHLSAARAGPDVHRQRWTAKGWLPAITFVFLPRSAATPAVKPMSAARRCGSPPTRSGSASAEIIDRRTADLNDADLVVLDYHEWREGLLARSGPPHHGRDVCRSFATPSRNCSPPDW